VKKKKVSGKSEIIGWREMVSLPNYGISKMAAKIDTGARTSALHAVDQRIFEKDHQIWVRFIIPIPSRRRGLHIEAPVVDERDIKNTGGVPERRLVIRTALVLGRHRWNIDVSLANREKMEFDLILGRTAIRDRGMLVHPGRSFLLGDPAPPNLSDGE
tara:strand:+ start:3799 stop:4272 length:474 start_codon:yes stop_codon:yes gene_type:complete